MFDLHTETENTASVNKRDPEKVQSELAKPSETEHWWDKEQHSCTCCQGWPCLIHILKQLLTAEKHVNLK